MVAAKQKATVESQNIKGTKAQYSSKSSVDKGRHQERNIGTRKLQNSQKTIR